MYVCIYAYIYTTYNPLIYEVYIHLPPQQSPTCSKSAGMIALR